MPKNLRYRKVHCLIWNDDKFPFVSDDCKLVTFHLLTTPFSTPFGLYKISLAGLADEMRWPVKRYQKAFEEAFAKGFVKYDEKVRLILLPNFLKHNPPGNPNVLKSWHPTFEELPASPLKLELYQNLKALLKGFGKGFGEAFAKEWRQPLLNQEQEQEQEQEHTHSKKKASASVLPEILSEEIWKRFLSHRAAVKAPVKKDSYNHFYAKFKKWNDAGYSPKFVVDKMVDKGWRGFEPGWLKEDERPKKSGGNGGKTPVAQECYKCGGPPDILEDDGRYICKKCYGAVPPPANLMESLAKAFKPMPEKEEIDVEARKEKLRQQKETLNG